MTDDNDKNQMGSVKGRPEQIGAYHVIDVLGEGGMAEVFLAEQPHADIVMGDDRAGLAHFRVDFHEAHVVPVG